MDFSIILSYNNFRNREKGDMNKMGKTLIAYFSRADENYFGGAMRYVEVGNTEIVCRDIAEKTGWDTFKIDMKTPYSPVYNLRRRESPLL